VEEFPRCDLGEGWTHARSRGQPGHQHATPVDHQMLVCRNSLDYIRERGLECEEQWIKKKREKTYRICNMANKISGSSRNESRCEHETCNSRGWMKQWGQHHRETARCQYRNLWGKPSFSGHGVVMHACVQCKEQKCCRGAT
jgi:hypothetical protein